MFYFNTLPKIVTPDQHGNYMVMTNIMSRATLIQELQDNPMLFYKYSIREGDTPEIIAEKYYGDPFAYWIVLHSNQLLDPLWDWPMTEAIFNSYLENKYAALAEEENQTVLQYTNSTIYQYQKITESKDNDTGTITTEYTSITQSQYNTLAPTTTTYTVGGRTCTIKVSKREVTIYDYEYELNEAKREIKLMDKAYVGQMEAQLKEVMST